MKYLRMFVAGFITVLGSLLPGYASADTQYNFSFTTDNGITSSGC